jgi:hypothetical protein
MSAVNYPIVGAPKPSPTPADGNQTSKYYTFYESRLTFFRVGPIETRNPPTSAEYGPMELVSLGLGCFQEDR